MGNLNVKDKITIGDVEFSLKVAHSQLSGILITDQEKVLLERGISYTQISLLNKLFGKEYIINNIDTIVERLDKVDTLLNEISTHDGETDDLYYRIVVPMSEPYNENLDVSIIIPYNKKMDDKPLIDLFSRGLTDILNIQHFVSFKEGGDVYSFSPSHMVYVDLFNDDNQYLHKTRTIPVARIKSDSLRFISCLPDNSVNYLISGVDRKVIDFYSDLGEKYTDKLVEEVVRTLLPGGIVMGNNFGARKKLDVFLTEISGKMSEWQSFLGLYGYKKDDTISSSVGGILDL